MSRSIGFGIGLPVVQQVPGRAQLWEATAGPAEIERVARAADRLGFAHVACSDHVLVPRSRVEGMGATWYDPVATLAHVGAMTHRIELLTHVLVLPYHHPLVLAKSLATLDVLTRGRLLVGVGSGHLKPEFKVLGVPFENRGALTDEYIDILREVWTEENPRFEGPTYRFRDVVLEPRPHRRPHPPLWIGGNTLRTVRRVVERGDGWVPWQIEEEELRRLIDHGREIAERAGRERPWDVVAPFATLDLLRREGSAGRADRLPGSPADVAAAAHRLRELGVSRAHVAFRSSTCDELVEQLEAFASEVMPLL